VFLQVRMAPEALLVYTIDSCAQLAGITRPVGCQSAAGITRPVGCQSAAGPLPVRNRTQRLHQTLPATRVPLYSLRPSVTRKVCIKRCKRCLDCTQDLAEVDAEREMVVEVQVSRPHQHGLHADTN
jgi:hypothetical protein